MFIRGRVANNLVVKFEFFVHCCICVCSAIEMDVDPEQEQIIMGLQIFLDQIKTCLAVFIKMYLLVKRRRLENRESIESYSITARIPAQMNHLYQLVGISDTTCHNNLRMPIHVFNRLCHLMETIGGLRQSRHVTIAEQVAMFLSILSHHKKNRIVQTNFKRSGYTISKHFNNVLKSILKLHSILLISPTPVPDESVDFRWKYFKVIPK